MAGRRRIKAWPVLAILAAALGSSLWAEDNAVVGRGYSDWTLRIGSLRQSIGGNERRFDQYVTPPSGVYPEFFGWRAWDNGPRVYLDLNLHDIGEVGPSADGYLGWGSDFAIDARLRRSAFYADFDPETGQSRRSDHRVRFGSPAAPNRRLFWHSAFNEWDLASEDNWRQTSWSNSLGVRAGTYDVSLDYRHDAFDSRTGSFFSGAANQWGLSFASTGSGDTSLAGAFAVNTVEMDRRRGRGLKTTEASLTATRVLRDNLSVWAQVRRRNVDETITENAYAQTNTSARFEARYTPRPRTSLMGFWETARVDYVDGMHLATVDVPVNTLGLDLRARPCRNLSFRGRYQHKEVTNRPYYYTVAGPLANTVVYGTRQRLDLSLSYAPLGKPWGVTGQWQREGWTNDAQSINDTIKTAFLTGWWQRPGSPLSLTASWMRQDFDLPQADVVTQLGFASRAEDWILGANYQLSRRTALSATYVNAKASGANTADYARTVLGVSHHDGHDNTFAAEVTLGNLDHATDASLSYDADLYRLSWQRKF